MHRRELQTEFVMRKYPPASSSPQTSTTRFYWIHVPSKNSGLVPQVLWRISEEEEMPIFIQSSCLTNLGSFYTRDPLPRFDSVDSANQSVKWVFAEPADETLVDGAIAFPTSGCGSLMQRTVITFRPPKGARRY